MTPARPAPDPDPLAGLSAADLKWPPGVGPGPVKRAYADGATLDQCARWFGITTAATAALLRANGIPLRPADAPPPGPLRPARNPFPPPAIPAGPPRPGPILAAPASARPADRLLTSAEVADLLRVDRSTVTRWARTGKLPGTRTPGGQLRYRETEVRAFLALDA